MKVVWHREAEAELIGAAKFYDSRLAGLGADFLDEIDAAVQRVREHPLRFPIVDEDVRRCNIQRFPYCRYFDILADAIRILAVRHHARHPDFWRARR